MRELFLGGLASMFFAVTFILNRSMELAGGSWLWSSSLRFFFMVPFLIIIVLARKNLMPLLNEMRKHPLQWLGWSFVGFVLFYAPITFAAAYGPGWLVAGTWQLTIVAGVLLGPLFFMKENDNTEKRMVRQKIPVKALLISILILSGVILIQWQQASGGVSREMMIVGILPVLIAAFAYPLGNRKMMELCGGKLDTFQRVLGMTVATIPFWLVIAAFGLTESGLPGTNQILQSFIIAICSGVIATTLFFIATDKAKGDQAKLAAVEATQSTQVLFVIIGEILLLSAPFPNRIAMAGLFIIVIGMLIHSVFTRKLEIQQKSKVLTAAKGKGL
ncbi:multidrug resistance efflux transporter family protein [Rossellomorea vietnamensis]|uniref:Multidrug resistance efflux transporter family protein n=1 Tax=Rossellomorea vietnamensis TaxID=218284 RepID=A0A5D4MIN8_9BACI|nr:multidrug resistance efflux transporter family protein [Rossellomorea vietnamensis]TYS01690.1 multidrug resistance efflux transporter family protein [Rossellomorea vietnamensis]